MVEMKKSAALTTVHKVTIGSAIGLGLLFSAFSAHRHNWIIMAATLLTTAALLLYLRWFLRKTA
jgi:hypothetical protein